MKNLLVAIVIVFSITALAAAQNMPSVQDRVERLKNRLSLTAQQATQVNSILTAAQDSARTITVTGSDRRKAMRQIMTKAHSDIMKILTDTDSANL